MYARMLTGFYAVRIHKYKLIQVTNVKRKLPTTNHRIQTRNSTRILIPLFIDINHRPHRRRRCPGCRCRR